MPVKVRLSLLVLFLAAARSNENFTVPALKASPFWNFTPVRSLKVYVLRSGDTSELSASRGDTLPSLLILVRGSKMLYCTISAIADAAPAVGSRPGGSSVMASTTLSFLPCAVATHGSAASAAPVAAELSTQRRLIMMFSRVKKVLKKIPDCNKTNNTTV